MVCRHISCLAEDIKLPKHLSNQFISDGGSVLFPNIKKKKCSGKQMLLHIKLPLIPIQLNTHQNSVVTVTRFKEMMH